MLLWSGIGDTIRVSLSADPVEEIRVGFDILKSLNLRHRGVNIISCPSCARQGFNVIETVQVLEERLKHISTPMSLSIIGCVVNGPGEARETDLAFTGGGSGKGAGMIYLNGKPAYKLENEKLVDHVVELCEKKAAEIEAARGKVSNLREPAAGRSVTLPSQRRGAYGGGNSSSDDRRRAVVETQRSNHRNGYCGRHQRGHSRCGAVAV